MRCRAEGRIEKNIIVRRGTSEKIKRLKTVGEVKRLKIIIIIKKITFGTRGRSGSICQFKFFLEDIKGWQTYS